MLHLPRLAARASILSLAFGFTWNNFFVLHNLGNLALENWPIPCWLTKATQMLLPDFFRLARHGELVAAKPENSTGQYSHEHKNLLPRVKYWAPSQSWVFATWNWREILQPIMNMPNAWLQVGHGVKVKRGTRSSPSLSKNSSSACELTWMCTAPRAKLRLIESDGQCECSFTGP